MALPTPLTPAQVGGSNDESELRASFVTGPHAGMILLVAKTDPNLASAVIAGDVVVEDPGAFTNPPGPVFGAISPTVSPPAEQVFVVSGSNFPSDLTVWPVAAPGVSNVVITPTTITFTLDYTGMASSTDTIGIRNAQDVTIQSYDITVAALLVAGQTAAVV